MDTREDADEVALANGFISIVPVKFDLTDYDTISDLEKVMNV